MKRVYGWSKPPPEKRGARYVLPPSKHLHPAIPSIDLRCFCPPVYDQGQLGSCTANAICGDHEFCQIKQQHAAPWTPSRLFLYYNERALEGDVPADAGACIHDGITSLNTKGVCSESSWPYDVSSFATQPPAACYSEALRHKSQTYVSLTQTLDNLKACLSSGYAFVFGVVVYSSFESEHVATTGIVPMPDATNDKPIGGHAMMCVGYDDAKQMFLVRNSWGSGWGLNGYCWMPYAYLTSPELTNDVWCVSKIIDD
ncbi:MAG: peptidase [Aquabacterium sp.]|uniref:C1 family peptidase n=1 Tax=Aquabacterium sp. TaxID=1872578 RepID=UPI00120D83B5|nr:MAG: peptidase [Aquabacterium sp.]TAL05219.1 MAG: peptidase [Chloroflexota bacterium]